MSYQYNLDLEFLGQCKNEELEILFNFLSYNRDGQKRLNGKLLDSEEYKLYKEDYNKYWKRIAEVVLCQDLVQVKMRFSSS